MWFKMGMEIINDSAMRELSNQMYLKDTRQDNRRFAFISLLTMTAEGFAECILDASHLARIIDTTPKQAQIVWDVCIKHGVLRKVPNGYSARQWMIERGILGDVKRRGKTDEQHQPQSQTGYRTDGGKTSW